MTAITYLFRVDWENDGDYTGTGEDVTGDTLGFRVRIQRGGDPNRPYDPARAGSARFELANSDGSYYPDGGGTPGSNTQPGRPVEMKGDSVLLFTGAVANLRFQPQKNRQSVQVDALDGLADLLTQTVTIGNNAGTTSTLIGDILDEVGWPAGSRDLDSGLTGIGVWWAVNKPALQAIQELTAAEGISARIWIDPDGTFVFRNRHHRIVDTVSTASQGTFVDTTTAPTFTDLDIDYGWADIVNHCVVDTETKQVAKDNSGVPDFRVLWEYPNETLVLTASQTVTYTITHSTAVSWVKPVESLRNPKYAYKLITGSVSSASISVDDGPKTVLTITAGGSGATLTDVRLWGVEYVNGSRLRGEDEDSTSVTAYGRRTLRLNVPWVQSAAVAQAYAEDVVAKYKDPLKRLHMQVANSSSTHVTHILNRNLSERVTVTDAVSSINTDFFIESVEHNIRSAGKLHTASFGLLEVNQAIGTELILDDATAGKLDTGTLAF